MYKPIPQEKIDKAKELLQQGYSIRSVAQYSGMSFISARKIYNGIPVGIGWAKKKYKGIEGTQFFNVDQMCWITGLDINRTK